MNIIGREEAQEAPESSEERYRRQPRDLALLHEVRSALAHQLDPAAVYRTTVEATVEAYGYTQVSAYRLKDDALLLEVVLEAADGARQSAWPVASIAHRLVVLAVPLV